jgi:hypothetical protein
MRNANQHNSTADSPKERDKMPDDPMRDEFDRRRVREVAIREAARLVALYPSLRLRLDHSLDTETIRLARVFENYIRTG